MSNEDDIDNDKGNNNFWHYLIIYNSKSFIDVYQILKRIFNLTYISSTSHMSFFLLLLFLSFILLLSICSFFQLYLLLEEK